MGEPTGSPLRDLVRAHGQPTPLVRFSQPVSAQTGLTGTHLYPDRRWSTGFRAGFRTAAGSLAHRVEQGTFNPQAPGSSPGRPTINQPVPPPEPASFECTGSELPSRAAASPRPAHPRVGHLRAPAPTHQLGWSRPASPAGPSWEGGAPGGCGTSPRHLATSPDPMVPSQAAQGGTPCAALAEAGSTLAPR